MPITAAPTQATTPANAFLAAVGAAGAVPDDQSGLFATLLDTAAATVPAGTVPASTGPLIATAGTPAVVPPTLLITTETPTQPIPLAPLAPPTPTAPAAPLEPRGPSVLARLLNSGATPPVEARPVLSPTAETPPAEGEDVTEESLESAAAAVPLETTPLPTIVPLIQPTAPSPTAPKVGTAEAGSLSTAEGRARSPRLERGKEGEKDAPATSRASLDPAAPQSAPVKTDAGNTPHSQQDAGTRSDSTPQPSTAQSGTTEATSTLSGGPVPGTPSPRAPSSPVPIPLTVQARPDQPLAQSIGLAIRKASGESGLKGDTHFTVRLKPVELGQVEVRIELTADGLVRAAVAAENPATLDLMRRDGALLERALNEAGLKTESSSLSFSMARHEGHNASQQNGGQNGASHRQNGSPPGSSNPRGDLSGETVLPLPPSPSRTTTGFLDVTA